MALIRTLTAECDAKVLVPVDQHQVHTNVTAYCDSSLALDPNITQVYNELIKQGWGMGNDGISIFCPLHNTIDKRLKESL